jgi:ATP-dependent DNA helicase RecG
VTKLDRPIGSLKGVGPRLEKSLERLGVTTVGDLLKHYPRRYDDFSQVVPISLMKPGPITIRGSIQAVASRRSFRRGSLSITEAIISDGTGTVKAIWFNQPYLERTLPKGTEVFVSGRLEFRNSDLALQSPAIESADALNKNTGRIVPIYPETEGITSKQLRGLILPLLGDLELVETMPPDVLKEAGLVSATEAIKEIHFPSSTLAMEHARRRIAFEELFILMLASLSIKQEIKTEQAPVIEFLPDVAKTFTSSLEFTLTDAQRAAAWQILQDVTHDQPMNRLLEGDVGSGKTVVAAMVAVMAMSQGFQVALMVPTEILARQHATKLEPLMRRLGHYVGLVISKQTAKERENILQTIATGQTQLVIGTHALLSDPVQFHNLGLVIIDEQHRFGVQQRATLKAKAGRLPHLLSMTATPIPRSLALTVYGDLDISVIDTLPPGRQPITTKIIKEAERNKVYAEVDRHIAEGRQVFVVCPLIDPSDKLGAKSAVEEADRLSKSIFKHRSIGVVHGKLKPDEKQAIMERFVNGELDILVATSVIEVGIDIPNATIMIIEGADRFGLAALHQLRGRVGRGEHQSLCYLLYDSFSPGVAERLRALEKTTDGFRLAQIDLELRGPGQIYGLRQHGVLDLAMADISDAKLLSEVRQAATDFLEDETVMLKYDHIREQVNKLKAVTSLD